MYTVVAQRELPAGVDRIWEFLTEPERLARWFADATRLAPGEPCRFDFGDGDFHSGRVVEWLPGITLGLRWTFLELGPEYHVRFSLLRRKRGTEVSVQDYGALTVEEAECLRVGWHEFLVRLERAVTGGKSARFRWRKLISFTARVGDRPRVAAALADPAWYRAAFPGVSARIDTATDAGIHATLTSDAWAPAATDLRLELKRIGAADYLYGYHGGWGELPPRAAMDERRRFVDRWRAGLGALGGS